MTILYAYVETTLDEALQGVVVPDHIEIEVIPRQIPPRFFRLSAVSKTAHHSAPYLLHTFDELGADTGNVDATGETPISVRVEYYELATPTYAFTHLGVSRAWRCGSVFFVLRRNGSICRVAPLGMTVYQRAALQMVVNTTPSESKNIDEVLDLQDSVRPVDYEDIVKMLQVIGSW